jgi:hypothetical protein
MQEAHLRRQMKEKRRDAAESEPDFIRSFNALNASEMVPAEENFATVDIICTAQSSTLSHSNVSRPSDATLSDQPRAQLDSSVARNRQKQLKQWAAARPTVPITSFYFTAPLAADVPPPLSSARVLLSGLGADELCGGYARYRTAYRRSGEEAARASMKADVDRIWLRNLGRDDRRASLCTSTTFHRHIFSQDNQRQCARTAHAVSRPFLYDASADASNQHAHQCSGCIWRRRQSCSAPRSSEYRPRFCIPTAQTRHSIRLPHRQAAKPFVLWCIVQRQRHRCRRWAWG